MNFEKFLLDSLAVIGGFDFAILIKAVVVGIVMFWFFVVVWVWNDAAERSQSLIFRVMVTLLVLPFNLFGYFIYLIIRPKDTLESGYWSELEKKYLLYETSEIVDCPSCGFLLRPGFNVCPNCAHQVKKSCDSCGVMIDVAWSFCPFCGANSVIAKDSLRELKEGDGKAIEKALRAEVVQKPVIPEESKGCIAVNGAKEPIVAGGVAGPVTEESPGQAQFKTSKRVWSAFATIPKNLMKSVRFGAKGVSSKIADIIVKARTFKFPKAPKIPKFPKSSSSKKKSKGSSKGSGKKQHDIATRLGKRVLSLGAKVLQSIRSGINAITRRSDDSKIAEHKN